MISVVMAYRDRREQLIRTLLSISKSEEKDVEIIIVDDCSSKDQKVLDLVDKFDLKISVFEIKPEQRWWNNPCVVFNKGFDHARGDVIVIQSPECLHVGDVLSYVKDNITNEKYLCLSCYAIVNKNMHRLESVDFQDSNVDQLRQSLVVACGGMDEICEQRIVNGNIWYCHPKFRSWAPHFTAAIMRNVLIKDFGGFDLRYAHGYDYDDTEFYHRIKKSNLEIVVPDPRDAPFVIHQFHTGTNNSGGNILRKGGEQTNSDLYHNVTLREKGWRVNREKKVERKVESQMKKSSYSSADVDIPVKLLHDIEFMKEITERRHVLLRHLQLSLTNKCTLNCEFCSCSDADREIELDPKRASAILEDAKEVGCKAITITGGGEPLLYRKINGIINECRLLDISVGLVTNGTVMKRLQRGVKWCRISFDPDRSFDRKFTRDIERAIETFHHTEWAFSFVLHKKLGDLKKLVEFANAMDFTHVRIVSDILNPNELMMTQARHALEGIDERVIYQSRTKPTRGIKRCLISLLKPVIGTDGNVYPCCGVQYAIRNSRNDFIKEMSMGRAEDIVKINSHQDYFDGSVCDVCYYQGYNNLLSLLMEDLKHKEWV